MYADLEEETIKNTNFRKVLFTTKYQQLVLMSIDKLIGKEMHEDTDQFIRIEEGKAVVVINGKNITLEAGSSITIPAGSYHTVYNTGTRPLKLYTIYSPPHHQPGLIQKDEPIF